MIFVYMVLALVGLSDLTSFIEQPMVLFEFVVVDSMLLEACSSRKPCTGAS